MFDDKSSSSHTDRATFHRVKGNNKRAKLLKRHKSKSFIIVPQKASGRIITTCSLDSLALS